ncbi:MazG nucleotide pyrophosphohydrolase domain-containing protein [Streptomonospora nanhaiensis]|uniref:MazG nucleotide pyrophosphohydrolase domain-containing protein n=1 Tax=Streptomonospora nanhaiensis TaxID=1323731 RepID=UPI001C38BC5A|nr:MazG nucleotide pyrophosphohydrolase domain-containing protein [Streptomonospora nanhaiensis]MBV2366960.1 hypothetical protein [Streptomonospora nanhaiensis]
MSNTAELKRLGDLVEQRIDELGLLYQVLADRSGMSVETLARIRHGHRVAARTYRKLEPALGWDTYSAERVMAGLEPGAAAPGAEADHAPTSEVIADLFERMGIAGQSLQTSLAFLLEEAGEVAKAVRRGDTANLAEELADVSIVVHHMAQVVGVDLDQAIRAKAAERLERHRAQGGSR